jgi:ParB family chromosome partitioning protein
MPDTRGHIELDRALESIALGVRHRKDPGDIEALMRSIENVGLLQPITITPEGVLVCGWRRLEAVRRLGWRDVKVWVRSGISDKLQKLMAQQDENEMRKPLTELEKAGMYRELKELRAEEAERRKRATQFGAAGSGEASGAAPGAGPGEPGDARRQAAMANTGSASYSTHERVCALMDWASRKVTPASIRAMANDALRRIEQGEAVKPLYEEVKAAFDTPSQPSADVGQLGKEALARVNSGTGKNRGQLKRQQRPATHFRSVRSFNLTWTELDGWTELYDVDELAGALTDADWERFDRVVTATIAFRDQLSAARRHARTAS